MAKNKLNDALRAEIVRRFAVWEGGKLIQAWLKEEHRIEVGLPALTPYNFDNALSRQKGTPKWVKLFDEVRAAAVEDLSSIRTAHKSMRMRILDAQIDRLLENPRPNVVLLKELLEHQAKEAGGMFTNRRELSGPGGGPIKTEDAALTDEVRADRVAALLDAARARRAGQPAPGS